VQQAALCANGALAQCERGRADYSYAQNPATARVFELVGAPVDVTFNSDRSFDLSIPLFGDGFETGLTDYWSAVTL
jgi:hypothetical protein